MAHAVVHHDEVEAQFNGVFKPMRSALGVTAFGVNRLSLPAGADGPEHDHSKDGQDEVYVIVEGSGKVTVGGEEHDVRVGHFVYADAGTRRQVTAGPEGISWIGIGCQPGGYTPRDG